MKKLLIIGMSTALLASGQTRVDLRTQGKSIDFTDATSTRPIQTGSVLPSTCETGQLFFKLGNPSGQNIYSCPTPNVWALQSGASAPGGNGEIWNFAQIADFKVERLSATSLTIGAGCSTSFPCNVRIGSTAYTFQTGATVQLNSGSGVIYVYLTPNGVLTVGHTMNMSCSTTCSAVSGITAFPLDSIPLFSWTAVNNNWVANGGTDYRAVLNFMRVAAGSGLTATNDGTRILLQTDNAVIASFLKASAEFTFSSIAAGVCAPDRTIALTGSSIGDPVSSGLPGILAAGLIGNMWVSATGQVSVRLCNISGSPITPGVGQYTAMVWKGLL